MHPSRFRRLAPAAILLLVTACAKPPAHGTANGVVVGARDDLWSEIEDSVRAAMQPTIFTVRQELTFRITQVDPGSDVWGNLAQFVQVLVFGDPTDPWVAQALDQADLDRPLAPPEIIQVHNVWATNQQVTIVLLPEGGAPEDAYEVLDELHALLDAQYRRWARNRMFLSGRDTALADTLRRAAGFGILLPNVYEWRREDSTYVFRNDNPDPSELIRQVAVTWRSPLPPPERIDQRYVAAWREALVAEHYDPGQVTKLDLAQTTRTTFNGHTAFVLQAIWENPPELGWPAAGPFITRALACPSQDRLYLLDAWLYAPGKDKYEYMIQLETILDSFECG